MNEVSIRSGHKKVVVITGWPYYHKAGYGLTVFKNVQAQNNNTHFRFSLDRKIRRFLYKKKM